MFISLTFIFILCLRTHAPERMRGVRGASWEMVLAFQHVSSRNYVQAIRFSSECLPAEPSLQLQSNKLV